MKKLLALSLVVATSAVALVAALPAAGASRGVTVADNVFRPTSLTVRAGTRIVFTWRGHAPHNVTVTSGPTKFRSRTQTKGRYAVTPHRRGTYRIVCTIHAPGMRMTLHVR